MTLSKVTYLILLAITLFGCSTQTNSNKKLSEHYHSDNSFPNRPLLDNVEIPKSWTEITLVDSVWTYSIPCHNDRELQTIELRKIDNQEDVLWNWGTAGQWFALKKINTQGDSLVFETLLPYDTTSVVLFTFKYLDKEKNIVRWGADGTYCTYIPTKDTSKYTKIQQLCD